MGADLPVLDIEIPALVIIPRIQAGENGTPRLAFDVDKSSVGKALLTIKVTVITNLHRRAVTHLQGVAKHARQCPDFRI